MNTILSFEKYLLHGDYSSDRLIRQRFEQCSLYVYSFKNVKPSDY